MIPKIIHYCWFGRGELPELAKRCIASWQRYCPDYQIVRWDEDNFDVNGLKYTKYCYAQKKYAFLSDYVRLAVVKQHGGIYLDTDVELLKSLDPLLQYDAYFGFENREVINTGVGFGAAADHPVLDQMLAQYEKIQPDESGAFELHACPALNTAALLPYGLQQNGGRQKVYGAEILPVEYLNPYDDATGRLHKTENTVSVHWYSKSWLSKGAALRSRITRPFHRVFGVDCFKWLKKW